MYAIAGLSITDSSNIRVLTRGDNYEFQVLKRSWMGLGPKKWRTAIVTHDYDYGMLYSEFLLEVFF